MPTINKPKKKKKYNKNPKNSQIASIYNTGIWKGLRESYLADHPLCEGCLLEGKTVSAEEVHHIKYISSGKDDLEMKQIAYNANNLIALCKDCHHKVHNNNLYKQLINKYHYEKNL